MPGVREGLQGSLGAHQTQEDPHRGEASPVPRVREEIQDQLDAVQTSENPHAQETLGAAWLQETVRLDFTAARYGAERGGSLRCSRSTRPPQGRNLGAVHGAGKSPGGAHAVWDIRDSPYSREILVRSQGDRPPPRPRAQQGRLAPSCPWLGGGLSKDPLALPGLSKPPAGGSPPPAASACLKFPPCPPVPPSSSPWAGLPAALELLPAGGWPWGRVKGCPCGLWGRSLSYSRGLPGRGTA